MFCSMIAIILRCMLVLELVSSLNNIKYVWQFQHDTCVFNLELWFYVTYWESQATHGNGIEGEKVYVNHIREPIDYFF